MEEKGSETTCRKKKCEEQEPDTYIKSSERKTAKTIGQLISEYRQRL